MGPVAASAHKAQSPLVHHARPENAFSDSVSRLLDRMDVRLAQSSEDREAISRLRYQAYLREGAISPNATGTFSDPYDEIGKVFLFGLYFDGQLASSSASTSVAKNTRTFPRCTFFPRRCSL